MYIHKYLYAKRSTCCVTSPTNELAQGCNLRHLANLLWKTSWQGKHVAEITHYPISNHDWNYPRPIWMDVIIMYVMYFSLPKFPQGLHTRLGWTSCNSPIWDETMGLVSRSSSSWKNYSAPNDDFTLHDHCWVLCLLILFYYDLMCVIISPSVYYTRLGTSPQCVGTLWWGSANCQ